MSKEEAPEYLHGLRIAEVEKTFTQVAIDLHEILVLDDIDLLPDLAGFHIRSHDLYGAVVADILVNHKRQSLYNQPGDFIFCKSDGDPLNQDVLRKDVLYPILDRLHIPRPKRSAGFHCFRHSAASLINNRTGNLKLAQNLLGHSNLSTTADVYMHTSMEAQREASEILEQAVFGNLFPSCSQKGTGTVK